MKIHIEDTFFSIFNEKTGIYFRSGILKDGKDTGIDPFMARFPELLDVGIMGHCIHGRTGLCRQAGIDCYQDGLHSDKPNMKLEDFYRIASQCSGRTYQFALGGCGDPDQHENFEEILKICRAKDIVPNFTTSGYGLTPEIAKICKAYCGAVAVSWYRSEYTEKAIQMLLDAGMKTNIHYVLHTETLDEAFDLLKNDAFPKGINAVVFLLHKPIGLGQSDKVILHTNQKFWELIDFLSTHTFPFKIGFDSCSLPALLSYGEFIDPESMDTCEGARFSAYITPDMRMLPCSFDQDEKWAVSLRDNTIEEAWKSSAFESFRERLKQACPDCKSRQSCMGGCPICSEIVLCKKLHIH